MDEDEREPPAAAEAGLDELRETVQRYRELFGSLGHGFCVLEAGVDRDGAIRSLTFREANDALARHTGLRNVVGRTVQDVLPSFQAGWLQMSKRVLATGEGAAYEHHVDEADRWYRAELSRVGGPGSRFVAVVFDDISERERTERALRESEERFRRLVLPFAQATWETAADGRIVSDSPSWRALTGQSLEDWLGQRWSRAVHPDDRDAALGAWSEAIQTGTIIDTEFRLRTADGTWRWTNVRAAPLIDADGTVRKWVGMNVDVTRRRDAEAAAQAERAQRDQREREFVDNAAHELRTPLAAMLASIDALEHWARDVPEEQERFLGHLRREAERLAQLSDSMLLLSELEAGGRAPQARVALPPLLHNVAGQVAPAAEVPVAVEVRPGLMATTNEGLLERILVNLADNAVKHTTEGRVELAAGRADSAVVIEVRDTGIGIAPEIAARVFDRFYRGGARRADGFGLGLSIARQAAEAIGATLELERREGPGTVARLALPDDAP